MKTNTVTIEYINLIEMSFKTNLKEKYEEHKNYTLNLKAALPQKNIDLDIKIHIIAIKLTSDTQYSCRAMYRELSDNQVITLQAISNYYKDSPTELENLSAKILPC